jgi:hypothetical protein
MASPFPGMDPYLEPFWRDVHARLIIYAADQLTGRLPGDLRARVEERIVVEPGQDVERSVYPDVRVIQRGRGGPAPVAEAGLTVAEPLLIRLPDEPATQTFIEIIDLGTGKRVVTVIEILSLSNKLRGEGQELYLRKRDELKQGGVSLVEIDLLRAGTRLLAVPSDRIPDSHRTPYSVCVRRGWDSPGLELYRVPLQERLPTIRVPLRQTDQDVPLELQPLVDQCYRNGGYDDDLDYKAPLDPPLSLDDAAWADALLRSQGRR